MTVLEKFMLYVKNEKKRRNINKENTKYLDLL